MRRWQNLSIAYYLMSSVLGSSTHDTSIKELKECIDAERIWVGRRFWGTSKILVKSFTAGTLNDSLKREN